VDLHKKDWDSTHQNHGFKRENWDATFKDVGVAKPKKNCINETQQKEGERAKEPLKTGKLLIRSLN
jgi:hypothetical protein